jgi:hypothetical protein
VAAAPADPLLGYRHAFTASAILMLLVFVLAFLVPREEA